MAGEHAVPPVLANPVQEVERKIEQVFDFGTGDAGRSPPPDRAGDNLAHIRARLHALSRHHAGTGYAIVRRADGTVVRSAAEVAPGEELRLRFAEDGLVAIAQNREEDEL